MGWTLQQQRAIDERGKSLLVSAAAGSGKTAVLTERVIKYIIDGGSADRLLIVTFTNAAAGEMKTRIAARLAQACRENPQNKHLRRQRIKLSCAKISTIDAYMASLLRENFEKLGISPLFGTMDDAELSFTLDLRLSELLETRYEANPKGFTELLKILGGDGENEALTKTVKDVYSYVQTIPFCDKWLSDMHSNYSNPKVWTAAACEFYTPLFAEAADIFSVIAQMEHLTDKERSSAFDDATYANSLLDACVTKNYNLLYTLCNTHTFDRMPPKPRNSVETSDKSFYVKYRTEFKKLINETELFKISEQTLADELLTLSDGIGELINIVFELSKAIEADFEKQNKYPFAQIAKMAFSLLVKSYDAKTRNLEITDLAQEIRNNFDEVLIDEYQDVNDLQDIFFSAIGADNMFAVGDVKQSIYAFRRANPQNFIRKKTEFEKIDLNKNFRSRKGILDFTNYVCRILFSSDVGGLEYDKNEELDLGSTLYLPLAEPDVELNIITEGDARAEAQLIADRIKKLIAEKYQITQKDGTSRDIRLSDIAILLRVMRNKGETFRNVLLENGIPVYMGTDSSFMQSAEVNTVLALLQAICNPYRDSDLFITMSSPLYGFSDDEIAEIRLCVTRKRRLYDAVLEAAKTNEKAAAFVDDLHRLSLLAANLPLSSLVWQIYTDKEYLSYVSGLEMGDVRYENLLVFLDFVRRYETDMNGGSLSKFLSFIRYTLENQKLPEQDAAPHGSYVTITTMHKSKGLEFPVCILPHLDRELSAKGNNESPKFLLDSTLGFGTVERDENMTFEQNSFAYELIKAKQKRDERSEALRLLYVALTRARQKLILIASVKEEDLDKLPEYSFCTLNGKAPVLYVQRQNSYLQLLLTALSHHPECVYKLDSKPFQKLVFGCEIKINISTPIKADDAEPIQKPEYQTLLSPDEIKKRFDFVYTPSLSHIPAKLSVTELAKGFIADEDSVRLFEEKPVRNPAFLVKKSGMSAAGRGTATHRFLALADLFDKPERQAELLVQKGVLTGEEANAINFDSIKAFEQSDLFAELSRATKIMREKEFLTQIPATAYDSTVQTDQTILMQGAIDLLCEFDDGYIIVDYKTDNKTEDELLQAYSKQLYYYGYAVNRLFGSVKKVYIWSLRHSKKIEIKL